MGEQYAMKWLEENGGTRKDKGSSEFACSTAEIRTAHDYLTNYILSCKIKNQPEWMLGLAEKINKVATALGEEKDIFYFDGDGISERQ